MCELVLAAWPQPVSITEIWPWARAMERYGLGGFGWGVAWRDGQVVRSYRRPTTLAQDESGVRSLAQVRSTCFLVHLRRPSQLTTTSLADTQPFLAESGGFAFAHNGRLDLAEGQRGRFLGRLAGRADSEVGFRLLEELLAQGSPEWALPEVHRRLEGTANFGYLPATGAALAYHGAPANQMWSFALDGARVVTTGLHSADDAIFQLCFPGARDRQPFQVGDVVALDPCSYPAERPTEAVSSGRVG